MNAKLFSLIAIAVAVFAAPFSYADTHNAPGTICQPYNFSTSSKNVGSHVLATATTTVICPLTNSGWAGATWAMVVTEGIANNDPSYFRCSFNGSTSQSGSARNLHVATGSGMTYALCILRAGDRVTSLVWVD